MLKSTDALDVLTCDFYNLAVRLAIYFRISNGTEELDFLSCFLGFQKNIYVYADISFAKILAHQSASITTDWAASTYLPSNGYAL